MTIIFQKYLKVHIFLFLWLVAQILLPFGVSAEMSTDIISMKLFAEIKVLDSVENEIKEMIIAKQFKDNGELFIISSIKQMIRTTQGVLIGQMELLNVDKYVDSKHRQEYSEQRFNSINLKKVVLDANKVELKRLNSYISNDRMTALTKKSTAAIKQSLMLLDSANKLYEKEILKIK